MAYSSHLRAYLRFCQLCRLDPIPASAPTLERYAAYLARTRSYTTVNQYLNIIRIIHREYGLQNPLTDNWHLKSVLQGIKRVKGSGAKPKSPISPHHLLCLSRHIKSDCPHDAQLWAATLVAFFGLLRVSSIASARSTNSVIKKRDIDISPRGITLKLRKSKTNQFGDKVHTVVLPYLKGHPLCPTTALLKFLRKASSASLDTDLFTLPQSLNQSCNLTSSAFRSRLCHKLSIAVPSEQNFSTHSLRRGGATWLLSVGTPLASIKAIGDWSSDAVFKYLIPDTSSRFDTLFSACVNLPK